MTKAEVRDQLVNSLEKTLLGPKGGSDETFKEFPTQRYIVGVLYPSETIVGPEQDVNNPDEVEFEEDTIQRNTTSIKSALRPSSIGMSFVIYGNIEKLAVDVDWATYSQEEKRGDFKRHEWNVTKYINVAEDDIEVWYPLYEGEEANSKEFELFVKTYKADHGRRYVSIFIVNNEKSAQNKVEREKSCMFSPSISIKSEDCVILAKERGGMASGDEDMKSLDLLYHERHEFGTGHGCSVEWDDIKSSRCGLLKTTFLPRFHWQPLSFMDDYYHFYMKDMSDPTKKEETLDFLKTFLDSYGNWISETFSHSEKEKFKSSMQDTFEKHNEECKISLKRMQKGVKLLEKEADVFKAFCFMNEAMFLQRVYSQASEEYRNDRSKGFKEPVINDRQIIEKYRWRPFQIAFILQAFAGIADPLDEDREIADLLWIPTGGGKTEAYLGLVAFTMAYRRLRAKGRLMTNYAGVNVMMRYTLRLLTIQQFQRAASLMSACEIIRNRNTSRWGQLPFMVGLFVGQSTTSNKIGKKDDYTKYDSDPRNNQRLRTTAYYALEYWKRKKEKPSNSNPFQLLYCPWCGEELDRTCYEIDEKKEHLITKCKRQGCPFENIEIPAITVDQDIYSRLPSMLIGTVDKFAMLPFNPSVGMLFGHVNRYCPTHGFRCRVSDRKVSSHRDGVQVQFIKEAISPPDLIIQDELHLINGPLGSMVGIYETTIDKLCSRMIDNRIITPKIIASTATIRRAKEQVKGLFGKDLERFPALGTNISDSFFVMEEKKSIDAKMYVGIFPSGIGQKTVMKRTMSNLLSNISDLKRTGHPTKEWDNYWTIVSYFNSIRDLGSAKTTIEDDIQNDVRSKRNMLRVSELTGRMDSKDLPGILAKLNITGDEDDAIDVLACSNMFSVGVDVQRLGVMLMNNQPKSTSEYIQSTGRVGRDKTGLVIVLYNWARARDQSHYERFYDYHNRIQSHVEAMTVTPFSEGARDRALHAQYVSMVRILDDDGRSLNSEAGNFDSSFRCSPLSLEYQEWIKERMQKVSSDKLDNMEAELNKFIDDWVEFAEDVTERGEKLSYEKKAFKKADNNYILRKIDSYSWEGCGGLPILTSTSMRNVEKEVEIHKIKGLSRRVR